jgi:hypothetical protein
MALVAFHLVPVAVAFFGAAVLLLLARSLSLREAYDVIDWPILVMLGALIPVSGSLRTTGGTDLIAGWLSAAAAQLPAAGALALILAAAMAVTPFLNNAATRSGDGADRRELRRQAQPQPRSVSHGGRHRRGLRLPYAHRPPVQHAGDGPRRLSLRRLLEARPAPFRSSCSWSAYR